MLVLFVAIAFRTEPLEILSTLQNYCFDWNNLTYTVTNLDTANHAEFTFQGKITIVGEQKFELKDSLPPEVDTIPNSYRVIRLWEVTGQTSSYIDVHETQTWVSNANASVIFDQNFYNRKLVKQ